MSALSSRLGFALLLALALAFALPAPVFAQVDYEANLRLVPRNDPAPTSTVRLRPEVRNLHPRLIFSDGEIERLRAHLRTDPILKANYDEVRKVSRRAAPSGQKPNILTGDTAALVHAGGHLPNLAYAYAIDGDKRVYDTIVETLEMYLANEHWSHAKELDSNMGAANNMLAAGILFDAVADDLPRDFRRDMAEKLFTHARRMYYLGHEEKALDVHKYWQQDPANNHRWHRAAGLAACLLAVADEPGIRADFMLGKLKEEMDFLMKWFPHDGDSHEGTTYQVFGFHFLAIAAMMMDRVIGTDYLQHPGMANAWKLQIFSTLPDANGSMSYGDSNNRVGDRGRFGSYQPAFFIGPRVTRDAKAQRALVDWYHTQTGDPRGNTPSQYPWLMLLYYDPTLEPAPSADLPTYRLFADMGVAYMRDSWDEDARLLMFKCGPYGGYKLNEFRNENNFSYVNVAHDDPDAGTFALFAEGGYLIHPGTYFTKKMTANHNTILVNGKGQIGEGDSYTQPIRSTDMTTLSYLTGWRVSPGDRIIVEGEAGNAYKDLEQFRRSLIWLPGDYVLILDRVAAKDAERISWQTLSPQATIQSGGDRVGVISKSGNAMEYLIAADQPLDGDTGNYSFGGRWSDLPMKRVQFTANAEEVHIASLFDAWDRGNLRMRMTQQRGYIAIEVAGPGVNDAWAWRPATDLTTPSEIVGKRGETGLAILTKDDKAPHGD